jgi:hypothetical protein
MVARFFLNREIREKVGEDGSPGCVKLKRAPVCCSRGFRKRGGAADKVYLADHFYICPNGKMVPLFLQFSSPCVQDRFTLPFLEPFLPSVTAQSQFTIPQFPLGHAYLQFYPARARIGTPNYEKHNSGTPIACGIPRYNIEKYYSVRSKSIRSPGRMEPMFAAAPHAARKFTPPCGRR